MLTPVSVITCSLLLELQDVAILVNRTPAVVCIGSLDRNWLAAETADQRPRRFRNFLWSVLSWSAHRYILQATHHDAQL